MELPDFRILSLGTLLVIGILLMSAVLLPLLLALLTCPRNRLSDWNDLRSSLYVGRVWHTRHLPVKHAFTYPLFIFAVDLQEIEEGLFSQKLWPLSLVVRFRYEDHLKEHHKQTADDSTKSLVDRIHKFVALKTRDKVRTSRETHYVLLVTHLAYFGYCFNPVSFYYLVEKETSKTTAVVGEVSNTPWNEMFSYVLHKDSVDVKRVRPRESGINFVFRKKFHVSPFMEMNYDYDWSFRDFEGSNGNTTGPDNIHVVTAMKQMDTDTLQFTATMNVHRRGMHPLAIAWQIVTYPCYCMILQIWIHYQAFLLFLKGVTFQPHPEGAETAASRIIGSVMVPFFAIQDLFTKTKKS